MKIKRIILGLLLILQTVIPKAQVINKKFFGGDFGMTFYSSEITNLDNVRGYVANNDYIDYPTTNLSSHLHKEFASVKAEAFMVNYMFGLSTGLRYSRIRSSIGKDGYWSPSSSYFYFLYKKEGQNTEYLRIKEIDQKSDYIGIPLEARFFPYRASFLRMYFKLGLELNLLFHSNTEVDFYDPDMKPYQGDVLDMMNREPSVIAAQLYGGFGFRFGLKNGVAVNIEGCPFSTSLNDYTSGLLEDMVGGGFQISVQIPLK